MSAAAIPLPALAEQMLTAFRPGIARLAVRAGVERAELPGIAIVITADALADFDRTRGKLATRWWDRCKRHFRTLGHAGAGTGGAGETFAPPAVAGEVGAVAGREEARRILEILDAEGILEEVEKEEGRTGNSHRKLRGLRRRAEALLAAADAGASKKKGGKK